MRASRHDGGYPVSYDAVFEVGNMQVESGADEYISIKERGDALNRTARLLL